MGHLIFSFYFSFKFMKILAIINIRTQNKYTIKYIRLVIELQNFFCCIFFFFILEICTSSTQSPNMISAVRESKLAAAVVAQWISVLFIQAIHTICINFYSLQ